MVGSRLDVVSPFGIIIMLCFGKENCWETNKFFEYRGTSRFDAMKEQDVRLGRYDVKLDRLAAKRIDQMDQLHNEKLYRLLGFRIDSWERYYTSLLG